ncbi:mechanosensitive ion channel family protein [Candidatus Woesearchaeota archaeon]|nr:mechanosensitive ion channel family protein [Candidatus Woesearchaeota archaeon]
MALFESIIVNDSFRFLFIFVGSILFANILHLILNSYFKRKRKQTKNLLYKRLQKNIIKPLYALIIFIGLYTALKSISLFGETGNIWIDNIFYASFILVSAAITTKIFTVIINSWLKKQEHMERPPQIISKILSGIIYIIAALILLDHFNIETTPFLATLGLGGLALGLALQSTLTNFFAGLHIVSDKPINIGDHIELSTGILGIVIDIGWRSTRLKTLQNTIIIVPNAILADSIITNNSSNGEKGIESIIFTLECGVSYSSDLKKVEKITTEVARKIQKTTEEGVKEFEPEIRFVQFAESNINFKIFLQAKEYHGRNLMIHKLIKELKEQFEKEGIEISFPVRKVYYEKDISDKKRGL